MPSKGKETIIPTGNMKKTGTCMHDSVTTLLFEASKKCNKYSPVLGPGIHTAGGIDQGVLPHSAPEGMQ